MLRCAPESTGAGPFDLLNNEKAGIDFINQLTYSRDFNVYKYRNYYNGGGVALGDVNNDGLTDIYFTSNLDSNRLYLNRGDLRFEDVTVQAGVGGSRYWSTGVTMVDINADGFLDIYVCNSGDIQGDNKENELFINNGDLTFTEMAADYGLNDGGFSTHALFFDYDKDEDLDVYLLNNSYRAIGSFNLRQDQRPIRDEKGGDKLLRNDDGVFVDVSESAGIYGSEIGFGLGISCADVNNDGWDDLYISNDFFERDYLYLNNQDGTFSEELSDRIRSISGASMGADIADYDNDGHYDLFVTEMLPSDPQRLKSVTTFEDWNKYQYNVSTGYHHQFTRNTLQYNNGDGTYSEIGRLAGVEASDWSWGALFFDMDNDTRQDLFIANGIYQDLTDQDYLQYVANEEVMKSIILEDGVNYEALIDIIPSHPLPNHFYSNRGDLTFERIHGRDIDEPSFSNGAAYVDLDNDGDLDLIVNNVNMPPFLYINRTDTKANFIQIQLEQEGDNRDALGAEITVTLSDDRQIKRFVQPARGFQSSSEQKVTIGLGSEERVSVEVRWPDGTRTRLHDQTSNELLTIRKEQVIASEQEDATTESIFTKVDEYPYHHVENTFSDFNRERLLYEMRSQRSPKLAPLSADHIVITGAKGAESVVMDQKAALQTLNNPLESNAEEHTAIAVADFNGDGVEDVYLGSGGVDVSPYSTSLYDQLFFGDRDGSFRRSDQLLPSATRKISTSVALALDMDEDGDQDLFVGERVRIGRYGEACDGFILENDGRGNFTDVTSIVAPQLKGVGMISDAAWVDLDADGQNELVIVGEFMGLEIFSNIDGQYIKQDHPLREQTTGWYHSLHVSDINGDGLPEIIMGNHGLNSRFRASDETPIRLYYSDFDQNGVPEGIVTYTGEDGEDYPYALLNGMIDQLKMIKKRFPDFQSYKDARLKDIFTTEELASARILQAVELRTLLLQNKGDFEFRSMELPLHAQFAPMFAIETFDYDRDGDLDIVMGGNQYAVKPEAGPYDASHGVLLRNDGASFTYVEPSSVGLDMTGQIRDLMVLRNKLFIAKNDDQLHVYEY
ncbi:MAG: VCBS repeat-containing protein [Bacteroidota bacterium]